MLLQAGAARATVDPEKGGRLASLRVDGLELLISEAEVDGDPMLWGCYPMVPWAGRVREGRFRFRGQDHELPLDAPPHAIHGVGYRSAWEVTGPGALRLDLDGRWPLGGAVTQEVELTADALTLTMTVTATDRAMAVVAGWHPCFRPRLDRGEPARLAIAPTSMWERDGTGIPTGRQVPVPAGPWDDAFSGLHSDPRITWPGAIEVSLQSTCGVWVVYDRDPRLLCVEPQTDAPDAFNREPTVLEPGAHLRLHLRIGWSPA
jgi:aldose 1-epimerase